MRIVVIFIMFLAVSVPLFGQQSLRQGSPAPAFIATGMDGQTYDLRQLQGRVVVLTFWSTKCAICHAEIPKLNRIAERYRGQNVVFLAATMENQAKVDGYLRKTPFNFSIVPNSFGMLLQYADRDRQGNIQMGFPAYFLLDQAGSVQLKTSGWDKTTGLDSKISNLLSANGNSTPVFMAATGTK